MAFINCIAAHRNGDIFWLMPNQHPNKYRGISLFKHRPLGWCALYSKPDECIKTATKYTNSSNMVKCYSLMTLLGKGEA